LPGIHGDLWIRNGADPLLNVFGPRQDPHSQYSAVIPLFITAMLAGRRPTVFGDGGQSRDFTYVSNVVHGNLLAADADAKLVAGRTFNVANGRSTSLLELLAILNELLDTKIQPIHEASRVGDVRESLADITQARQRLGYEPQLGFEEACAVRSTTIGVSRVNKAPFNFHQSQISAVRSAASFVPPLPRAIDTGSIPQIRYASALVVPSCRRGSFPGFVLPRRHNDTTKMLEN